VKLDMTLVGILGPVLRGFVEEICGPGGRGLTGLEGRVEVWILRSGGIVKSGGWKRLEVDDDSPPPVIC
jgi:hypothetical protein